MISQEQLDSAIERAQKNDPAGMDDLVEEYAPRLYGFMYKLTGERDQSEELVQEAFVRLVRTIGQYEHRGRFEAWLFRIAANLARDRVRRISRAPTTISLESVDEDGGDDRIDVPASDWTGGATAERAVALEGDMGRLQTAIGELPTSEREVILLRHYSSMKFTEIADVLGIPLGTALARSHRGLVRLRKLMEPSE